MTFLCHTSWGILNTTVPNMARRWRPASTQFLLLTVASLRVAGLGTTPSRTFPTFPLIHASMLS